MVSIITPNKIKQDLKKCHLTILHSKMPMIGVTEKALEQDRKIILRFMKDNPYPSYKQVIDIIKNDRAIEGIYLDVFAEYGQQNHQWVKEIYENIMEEELVKQNGNCINERGGMTAMQFNHYTLVSVLRYLIQQRAPMKDYDVTLIWYNIRNILSSSWNIIGEWRH